MCIRDSYTAYPKDIPNPQIELDEAAINDPCKRKYPLTDICAIYEQKFRTFMAWMDDSEIRSNELYNYGSGNGMPVFIGFSSGGSEKVEDNILRLELMGYDPANILARAAGYTDEQIAQDEKKARENYDILTGENIDDYLDRIGGAE